MAERGPRTAGDGPWELVVIGGGSAGLTAARTARLLGAQVVLVERARLGGDCLWTGCIPSKALIAEAHNVASARRIAEGAATESQHRTVFAAIDRARDRIAPTDSAEGLQALGVSVLHGDAAFDGPHSLLVDGRQVSFQRAIIATGSHPALPEIPGLEQVNPLTSDTVWDLRQPPDRLLVLGGGPIGCELAQAFARLGTRVTLVHRGGEILPAEVPAARATLRRAMLDDGVQILTGQQVTSFQKGGVDGDVAILDDGGRLEFQRVLVATGRLPAIDGLGLVRAGIELDEAGWVRTNRSLRTANRAVWAAGDVVTWLPKHTHTAGVSGAIAARNALLGTSKAMDATTEPRVIFTAPEIASVGVQSGEQDRARHRTVTLQHRHVDRAVAEDETRGFTQIVVSQRGRILGGTIVGPRAGESLGELALAVDQKVTVAQLTSVTHPYPTFNDGLWNTAIVDSQRRIRDGLAGRVAGIVRTIRRIPTRKSRDR